LESTSHDAVPEYRQALRKRLLLRREEFVAGPQALAAASALSRHLAGLLLELEPELVGVYWPHRSEFNAAALFTADPLLAKLPIALPFAQRKPVKMHYRAWDGKTPAAVDECGIAASSGAPVVPDVVLVPCVGFTREGFRLGYGGGYFDRWLAANPDVTAIGVAYAASEIDDEGFAPQPHDEPLTLIVTEDGVV
jgi:5-formyltetrahydrofolate cyclo-ligase